MLKKLFVYILGIYNGLFGIKTSYCSRITQKQSFGEDKCKQDAWSKKINKLKVNIDEISSTIYEITPKYQEEVLVEQTNDKVLEAVSTQPYNKSLVDEMTNVYGDFDGNGSERNDTTLVLRSIIFCAIGFICGYLVGEYLG